MVVVAAADWTTARRWAAPASGSASAAGATWSGSPSPTAPTLGNGTNGIFLELQKAYWPPPRGYRIIGCHSQGNRFGISDWGADGLIVSACTMTGNLEAGFDVSAQGTSSVAGRGGM